MGVLVRIRATRDGSGFTADLPGQLVGAWLAAMADDGWFGQPGYGSPTHLELSIIATR